MADHQMIASVIRNLVGNSIKFTPNGGTIKINANANQYFVEVEISDSGVGIDEVKIKEILSKKEVKPTKGTENEQGSGVGLSLCQKFIELNGGTFTIESKLNSGTKYIFSCKQA